MQFIQFSIQCTVYSHIQLAINGVDSSYSHTAVWIMLVVLLYTGSLAVSACPEWSMNCATSATASVSVYRNSHVHDPHCCMTVTDAQRHDKTVHSPYSRSIQQCACVLDVFGCVWISESMDSGSRPIPNTSWTQPYTAVLLYFNKVGGDFAAHTAVQYTVVQ